MKNNTLKPLAIVFALGGIWDAIAGMIYILAIGNGRLINNPPIDPFYAIFLGSFFLCFAYLQILSAFNIRKYAFNIGCLIFGRLFYVVVLYYFIFFKEGFPPDFWFTGIIDGIFLLLYISFIFKAGLKMKEVFLPSTIKQTIKK